jgi:hypothetical protein
MPSHNPGSLDARVAKSGAEDHIEISDCCLPHQTKQGAQYDPQ